ncbi:MAG: DUF4384 domain-containing protein [Oxalobacteraceae bacterium]|jgi:hypothetical protein|nr:DUF4384 domain-containing protein [Oxalobacteraceae bacterium]
MYKTKQKLSVSVYKTFSRRFLVLTSALFLISCSTPMDVRKDAAFQSYANLNGRPSVRPVRSMSSFSDSLDCMDKMLRDAEVPSTLVTSKQIPDFSTRAPVATKDMIITALLQMSRTSNTFRYVDYEVDIVRQDTVQNLTNILLNNNQIQLQRPSLYFSGSIAFLDQNVLINRYQAGVSQTRFDGGYSQNRNASIIGLELHLGDFRTRTLIPGLDSANEVILGTGGQGLDLAGRISDYGLQFNVGRDYAQGTGTAIRTLVELAVIELTGKWARVPYWQCLTLEQTHPSFQRQLRDWYDEGDAAIHRNLIQSSLISKGYLDKKSSDNQISDSNFRRALGKFQADHGMVVNGVIDFKTYERVLRDYVSLDAKGNLVSYGWAPSKATQINVSAQPPSSGKLFGNSEEMRTIDLQIENILMGRSKFEVGEQIFLSATVSRSSYLYCYLSNSSGSVMRLLPNAISPRAVLAAGQTLRMPDWMSPNPGYVIDAAAPGKEGLLCIATDNDVYAKLDDDLQVAGLTPIPNVDGLPDLLQRYSNKLNGDFTHAAIYWDVVPKKTVKPAQ